jgi:hypothetical protein
MTLLEELKERADKLDAELLALSGRIKEIERESDEVHTCINALDIAEMDAEDNGYGDEDEGEPNPDPYFLFPNKPNVLASAETTESEPDPVLRAFEDDQIIAPAPLIDAQTCEEVDPRVSWDAEPGPRPEDASVFSDDPAPEGCAPVTNPEADAHSRAMLDYYSPEAQAAREREESFLNRFNPFRVKADA